MRTFLWSPSALSPAADRTTAESAKPLPAATRPSGARRRLAGPGVLLALAAMALAFQPAASRGQSSTNTWLQTLPDPGNTNWSNGANWSLGTGVPAGGPGATPEMALVFDSSNHTTSTHDGDRVVHGMTFTGASNFTIAASGGVIYAGAGGVQVDGGNHTFNAQFRPRESLSVINNGGPLQFNQNFMVHLPAAGAATITFGGSGDTVLANIIRRTSGMDVTLVKTGSGSLTVNGGIGTGTPATSNQGALAGNIDVLEGTLATPQLRIGTATTSSVVTVAAGATLNVTGNTTTIDSAVGPDFGTLNVAGTFNEAGNLIVGQDNTGMVNQTGGSIEVGQNVILAQNAGSTGTINQSGGLFTVTGNLAEPAGGGTSTVNLNDGVMNIGGDLSVDNLQVGFTDGIGVADATLTVGAGSNVRIGDGGGFLTIARMVDNPPDPDQGTADSREALGTLDLRQAATTVIDVNQIRMATSNLRGRPHGELLLGGNTTLSANLFRMADVEGGSTPGGRTAALSLGQDNDFNIDTWIVGGSKSSATVGFDPGVTGGVLNLSGNTNAGVNLTIGDAQFSTGANTTSTFNTLDHTFNATIDTLRLGNFNTSGAGSSSGVLTMDQGTVNANQVVLGQSTGSNQNATTGTLALNGGEFIAGSITRGTGTANFNFNAGLLAFETFGSASTPFHLNNTGSGQLEFGVDTSSAIVGSTLLGTGTLFGNYTQGAGAAIAFDLSFNPGADLFVVDGDVNLDGQLIVRGNGPYAGELLAPITLIENLGGNPVSGTFAGLAEGAVVAVDFDGTLINYFISYQGGPDGNNVILNVPEPGRALLLAIALGCLLARRRRNG